MLDIGFSELVVIGGVALVVLGPEKLAVIARTTGKMMGRAQGYVNDVKADIAREGELAELRKLKSEIESAGQEISGSVSSSMNALQTTKASIEQDLNKDLSKEINKDLVKDTGHDISAVPGGAPEVEASPQSYTYDQAPFMQATDADFVPPLPYTPNYIDPTHDPVVQRMELELLNDDISAIEKRLSTLKAQSAAYARNMAVLNSPEHAAYVAETSQKANNSMQTSQ